MKNVEEIAKLLDSGKLDAYGEFPDIELYMDQVLTYLSRRRISLRKEDALTSAMVNNYIKDSLLPRASGKKYNREHLACLTIIARLKQVLSVKDLKVLLPGGAREGIEEYYGCFGAMLEDETKKLLKNIESAPEDSLNELALSLAVESYISKTACEFLLDKIAAAEETASPKKNPANSK